jgi:hypothetical protein
MRLNTDLSTAKYKFTAQLSDGDYASWKENGHFKSDDEVWKWDLVQELPIDWCDFTVEAETPYGKGMTFRFLDTIIYQTISSQRLKFVYTVSLPRDSSQPRETEWYSPQEALAIVRKHYAESSPSITAQLSLLDTKTRVMMDELLIMRKKIQDMMECSNHIR